LINEALLVADQMLLQPINVPHWFLISMFLRVGFSGYLQALVQWCSFHAARGESEWCILLWCLAAQTVAARHLPSCWLLLLSSAARVHKSTELLPHETLDFTPDVASNRPDLSSVDYRLLRVIQECVYQKQQETSDIVDELWLLTEWHFINRMTHYISQGRVETPIRRGEQLCWSFVANLLRVCVCQKLSKYNAVWQSYCKNKRVQCIAPQCRNQYASPPGQCNTGRPYNRLSDSHEILCHWGIPNIS